MTIKTNDLERKKLELEERKLKLEIEKLSYHKFDRLITMVGVFAAVILAFYKVFGR